MVNSKDIKKALVAVVKQALKQKYSKDSKTVKDHAEYANRVHKANYPDKYIKFVAKRLFPNEDAYNKKIEHLQKYYKEDLLTRLEELYNLYYELAQEEAETIKKAITDAEAHAMANDILEFSIEDDE